MKVRQGFVSNSSSSSYILAIPSNFDIESHPEFETIFEDWKFEAIDQDRDEGDESTREEALEKFRVAFQTLKDNFLINWENDKHGCTTLGGCLPDDLSFGSICGGPDDGCIINILAGKKEARMKKLLGI